MQLNLLGTSLLALASTPAGTLISHFENVLGTSLELKIKASTKAHAEQAEAAILSYLQDLQEILGASQPGQGLYEFNQSHQKPMQVAPELREVMQLFLDWQAHTQGAIHPNTHALTQVWRQAALNQELPDPDQLLALVEAMQESPYEIHEDGRVSKLRSEELRLHSLAKGYVMEKAAEFALKQTEVKGVVINLGGDLTVKGDIKEWVKIVDPSHAQENAAALGTLVLENKSLASSGNYKQGFSIQSKSYSHIFNPKTARPAQDIVHASVIHEHATSAGAMATAFNVMATQEAQALASKFQADYLIIDQENQPFKSEHWAMSPESSIHSNYFVHHKEKVWNPNLELQINLQLADLGGYARRPYVAVWIEDENQKPIRRLAIWYRKPRWLPDLREFSASLRQAPYDITSITSATRSAGKYSLVWDGKDDAGQWVPQGNYTVFIEAAREHGTYQLIKQKIICDEKTKQLPMPGNEEVASASLVLKSK